MLDKATLQVVRRVTVGFEPRSVAVNPVTRRIYVVNRGIASYNISVIDASTLTVVATIPCGQAPIDVAVNSRLNRVYVSNLFQKRIHVIDGATNQQLAPIEIGAGPVGLAVDETTNRVYVALNNHSVEPFVNALGVVTDSGSTYQIQKVFIPGTTRPEDVAVDPHTDRVYLANLGGGGVQPSVTVLQAGTNQILATVILPGAARGITVNGYAHQVFVSTDDGVQVVDDATLSVVRSMPAGSGPQGITTATGPGRTLYVVSVTGELRRLSYSSGTKV